MTAAQFSQIVGAPWRQRDRSSPWGRWVFGALIACCVLVCFAFLPWQVAWRPALAIIAVTVHGAWMSLGMSLAEQNHPLAARCVPGHVAALRHATLAAWALCTGVTTLLFGLLPPAGPDWALVLLTNSVAATFLLWASQLWWLWLLVGLHGPLIGLLAPKLAPLWAALAALWHANVPALLAGALLLQVWAVRRVIRTGNAVHRETYRRQAIRRSVMRMVNEGRQPGLSAWDGRVEWLFRPFEAITDAWRAHLLAGSSPRHLLARVELVLHGQQHWLLQLMGATVVLALAAVAFGAAWLIYDVDMDTLWRHGTVPLGITLESLALNPLFALPAALWQTRREQALLRLLPGLPQGAALNRAVALGQLRYLAVAWPLAMLTLSALASLGNAPVLPYFPLGALPVALLVLTQRPAMLCPQTPSRMLLPTVAGLALGGLLYLPVAFLGVPAWTVFVSVAALSAALLAWRWRGLVAAPMALPAGRLN